jgi:hypothetical protein
VAGQISIDALAMQRALVHATCVCVPPGRQDWRTQPHEATDLENSNAGYPANFLGQVATDAAANTIQISYHKSHAEVVPAFRSGPFQALGP